MALTQGVIQHVKDGQVLPVELQLRIVGSVEAEGVETAGDGLAEHVDVGFGPVHSEVHGPVVIGGHESAGTPEQLPATRALRQR